MIFVSVSDIQSLLSDSVRFVDRYDRLAARLLAEDDVLAWEGKPKSLNACVCVI
jgi:hypothetical protein